MERLKKLGFVRGILLGLAIVGIMGATVGGFSSRPRVLSLGVNAAAPATAGNLTASGAVQSASLVVTGSSATVNGQNVCLANGTNCPAGAAPGSPSASVQFNNAGAFAGDAGFTYDAGTDTITLGTTGSTVGVLSGHSPAGANGNTLRVETPDGPISFSSGPLFLRTGAGGASGGGSGDVNISTGTPTGAGTAGHVNITLGNSPSGTDGNLIVTTGGPAPTINGSAILTAASTGVTRTAVKTADTSRISTITKTCDNHLVIADGYAANTLYALEG